MNEIQQLGKRMLSQRVDLLSLVADLEAEPLWQVRHLLAEPAKSHTELFAVSFDRLKNMMASLETRIEEFRELAEGKIPASEIRPGAEDDLRGFIDNAEIIREPLVSVITWAREMRNNPGANNSGASLN